MRYILFAALLCQMAVPVAAAPRGAAEPRTVAPVYVLDLDGQIDPAITSYLIDGIKAAERGGAQAVLITMDTPGGLMSSMQQIIKAFFASSVPIIVFVSPDGATAASAGAFITMAAHIAAMAPVSNIGSASPVSVSPSGEGQEMGTTMKRKVENFAAEYAHSIAERRGRNVEWAEQAVRKAANLTSTQALTANVIDYVAGSVPELMAKIDGRKVEVAGGRTVTLRTAKAPLERTPMGPWDSFLHYLSNPLVAMFLFLAAMYGLIYELSNPGSIFPGVVGGIALLLLLYSFSVIPVSIAGLAFVVLGMAFFAIELFTPSHGILAVGGVVSFFFGLMMLFRAAEGFMVSVWIIAAASIVTGGFFLLLVGLGLRALAKPYIAGREGVVGQVGEARTDLDPTGKVFVNGALWTAASISGKIEAGQPVEITEMVGLKLKVRKLES